MNKSQTSTTNIFLKTKDGRQNLLVKIIALKKANELFMYKFIINRPDLSYVTDISVDAITGYTKSGVEKKKLGGILEVGYHTNGNVTYKDAKSVSEHKNLKPRYRHRPFSALSKPDIFLKFTGLPINYASGIAPKSGRNECIDLIKYQVSDRINCDFYLASNKIAAELVPPSHSRKMYPDHLSILLEDEENPVHLVVFIYRCTDRLKGTYFCIVDNTLQAKLKRTLLKFQQGQGHLVLFDILMEQVYKIKNYIK